MVRQALSGSGAVGLALLLSGCFGSQSGPIALSGPGDGSVVAQDARTKTPEEARREPPQFNGRAVKTVRSGPLAGGAAAEATDPVARDPDEVLASSDPLPTASQIFDFHPPGSKPDTWRQPFVFTDNDGPLVAYRDRTAAMLKELRDPSFEQRLPKTPATTAVPTAQ